MDRAEAAAEFAIRTLGPISRPADQREPTRKLQLVGARRLPARSVTPDRIAARYSVLGYIRRSGLSVAVRLAAS